MNTIYQLSRRRVLACLERNSGLVAATAGFHSSPVVASLPMMVPGRSIFCLSGSPNNLVNPFQCTPIRFAGSTAGSRGPPIPQPAQKTIMNDDIRSPQVRLIDAAGEHIGTVATAEALYRAEDLGLDLVMINPTSEPPVCRIMDYGQFTFSQRKQTKLKKKVHDSVKEIRLSAKISDHDRVIKLERAREFLEKTHRVQVTIQGQPEACAPLAEEIKITFDSIARKGMTQIIKQDARATVLLLYPKAGVP